MIDWDQSEYLFAVVFAIVILAELTITVNPSAGYLLHFIAIFIAVFYVIFTKKSTKNTYIVSLTLPSILRIVNFSMPIFFPYTIYWFPIVYSSVLISVYAAAKVLNLSVDDLGFTLKRLYLYVPAGIVIGILLSLVEFRIIKPECLIPDFSIGSIVTLCIVMYAFAALTEELVFRSVLQSSLEKKFGLLKGLLLATAISAVMHAEYGFYEVVFAFFAGLMIGFIFQKTRSLPFIVVIHGTINVMIFGFLHAFTGTVSL
jgi:membrane protease YdiL (CAAX protease family)